MANKWGGEGCTRVRVRAARERGVGVVGVRSGACKVSGATLVLSIIEQLVNMQLM